MFGVAWARTSEKMSRGEACVSTAPNAPAPCSVRKQRHASARAARSASPFAGTQPLTAADTIGGPTSENDAKICSCNAHGPRHHM